MFIISFVIDRWGQRIIIFLFFKNDWWYRKRIVISYNSYIWYAGSIYWIATGLDTSCLAEQIYCLINRQSLSGKCSKPVMIQYVPAGMIRFDRQPFAWWEFLKEMGKTKNIDHSFNKMTFLIINWVKSRDQVWIFTIVHTFERVISLNISLIQILGTDILVSLLLKSFE